VKGFGRARGPWKETEPEYEFVLSENQQEVVDMVKEIARRHCLEVEVVDVAEENVLRRVMQREREKIKIFPTLIAGSGQKIQGEITEKQVESLLSRIADETRKKYL
jgi:pheromone shutdown protein TraB